METYSAAEMTTFTCDYGMFTTATGTIATVLAHHDMFPTATVEPILTRLWHIMTFIPLLRLRPIPKPFYHIMTCLLLARRGQYRHGSGTSWHVCYGNYGTDNRPALAHYELFTSANMGVITGRFCHGTFIAGTIGQIPKPFCGNMICLLLVVPGR